MCVLPVSTRALDKFDLAVQFGGREAWTTRPYVRVVVVAVSIVTPEYAVQHVEEARLWEEPL